MRCRGSQTICERYRGNFSSRSPLTTKNDIDNQKCHYYDSGMKALQHLAQDDSQWSLEEFVQVVNDLLPQFLPQVDSSRVQEDVNPRLVRHYTTQGLLDKPLKQGREARYIYRHVLQLLVVRRLLTEGYGSSTIANLIALKSNLDLEALLHGGVQLTVQAANPALSFLQQIQQRKQTQTDPPKTSLSRSSVPPAPAAIAPPPSAPASPPLRSSESSVADPLRWVRIEILPGLEIHVREDFIAPNSPQEQQNLLDMIADVLSTYPPHSKRRSL